MDIDFKRIGERIKSARKEAGYTQAQLADKAGVSISHYCNIENGKKDCGLEVFVKIIDALSCSADSVLGIGVDDSTAQYEQQLYNILEGCSDAEKDTILEAVRNLRKAFSTKK